jgi:Methyltransferase domain
MSMSWADSMISNAQIDRESLVLRPNESCPLGCDSGREKFCEAYGSGCFSKQLFIIWKCKSCGLGFTDPIPTEDTSHLLYKTRESNDFQPDDSKLVATLKTLSARRDVRTLCQQASRHGTMLDYGCGNGAFARAMQKEFPRARIFGSDQHLTAPSLLDEQTYIPNSQLQKNTFDFILCRHVLEHTYNPVNFLCYLRSL